MSTLVEKAIVMLYAEEGVKDHPYDDATGKFVRAPVGNITIGVGHNLDAKHLSPNVINAILEEDIADADRSVRKLFKGYSDLSENRRLALLDMAFTLGELGLSRFVRFIDAINAAEWEAAATEIRSSLWGSTVVSRADRKITMIIDDTFPY